MKVCVGLSGGVDSSVAALLLKRQGYDVFAMYMQNWHDADATLHGDCEWEEERFLAEMVARKIGIPFYFVDLSGPYRQRVVDYMFAEYAAGRTPNPDVLCNREIKFDAFLDAARKMGADMVATGHYCRKDTVTLPDGTEEYRLLAGLDPGKDQSYFLCQLSQEQLSRALFPIGGLMKSEVRAIAAEADLPSAGKKDSQGICFVGKVDLPVFLQQKLKPCSGKVVEVLPSFYGRDAHYREVMDIVGGLRTDGSAPVMFTDYVSEQKAMASDEVRASLIMGNPAGEAGCRGRCPYGMDALKALPDASLQILSSPVAYPREHPDMRNVGTHDGAQFYTVGQRKGLGIGGYREPVFVIGTDVGSNRVFVGEGHHHPGLFRYCLKVERQDIHWVRPSVAARTGQVLRLRVRIRYRQPLQDAVLIMRESGLYVLFDEPQRGITAGQFAAWYDRDDLLGSGVISR